MGGLINLARAALKNSADLIISLFLLVTLSFFLMKAFPGGPFDDEAPLNPEVKSAIELQYGLHQPLVIQYKNFLGEFINGSMGVSLFYTGKTVRKIIADFAPISITIGLLAFILALSFGIFISVSSFMLPVLHRSLDFFNLILIAVPTLLLGPLLIYLFGFYFNVLPVALLESPKSYILPVVVLSLRPFATLSRILKSSLQESLFGEDIKTMRAYGFSERKILFKWALRKSWLPFLSQIPSTFASLIAGSLLVEILFAIPGLGSQYVDSMMNRDVAVVVGLTVFYGAILLITQYSIEFVTTVVDKRL